MGTAKPETMAEAAVRKLLPKDEHIVMAWIGSVVGLVGLSKIGGKKKAPEDPPRRRLHQETTASERSSTSQASRIWPKHSDVPLQPWSQSATSTPSQCRSASSPHLLEARAPSAQTSVTSTA